MSANADAIRELASRVGFFDCGVTSTGPFTEFADRVRERMAAFPDASALYEGLLGRAEPRSANPWASSIIVCIRHYGRYRLPDGLVGHIGRNYLCDRRFRESPDYRMSSEFKNGLVEMGLRVRKGGVPDRWAAVRAGVGRFGRNGFVYSRNGSWINIECWLVDADLPPDEPDMDCPCPVDCRACIDACPTAALCAPYIMRMDHCIAYLTYSAPEPVRADLWEKMGGWIYGCDTCQDVCPLNRDAWDALEDATCLSDVATLLQPAALAVMNQQTYEHVVHPRFWYIRRDNLERWHRNARRACAAMDEELSAPLERSVPGGVAQES